MPDLNAELMRRTGSNFDYAAFITGALMIDAKYTLHEIRDIITPESFTNSLYRDIYQTALDMDREGTPIDPITLRAAVERGGHTLSDAECMELMRAVPSMNLVSSYAERISEQEDARSLSGLLLSAYERLTTGENIGAVRGDLERELQAVKVRGASALVGSGEAINSAYRSLCEISGGKQLYVGSGYGKLNRVLGGGFIKSGLHILAARPGTGKTTLALQIAENAAEKGIKTLFISLEMSVEQLQHRRLAVAAGLPLVEVLNISEHDLDAWKKLSTAAATLSPRPLIFNRLPGLSVPRIERMARSAEAGLLVIDYLGLIAQSGGKSLYERVTETSGALKRMAVSLGIPVLCLCQLNRGADGKKPSLSELRDSGAIEQDADTVLLQWLPGDRPEKEDGLTPVELEVIVAKNRHGPLGRASLNWYMQCGRIRE